MSRGSQEWHGGWPLPDGPQMLTERVLAQGQLPAQRPRPRFRWSASWLDSDLSSEGGKEDDFSSDSEASIPADSGISTEAFRHRWTGWPDSDESEPEESPEVEDSPESETDKWSEATNWSDTINCSEPDNWSETNNCSEPDNWTELNHWIEPEDWVEPEKWFETSEWPEPDKLVEPNEGSDPNEWPQHSQGSEPNGWTEPSATPIPDHPGFVTGLPLCCLMTGLMLAQFLISLDRTIISTAIPYITHEFASTPDLGWYGSAYLLTACAFQPLFGRIFMIFSIKKAYLLAVFLFEAGSLLCGVAPNSLSLIVGRAIAGLGSAGILTGSFVVVGEAVPLQLRPIFMAVVGTMYGVGATTGPLLGGVFTDLVSWRWCFYVNLPIGAATVATLVLFFHPNKNEHSQRGLMERIMDLDIFGNALLLGSAMMTFLALEYTMQGMAWSSARIIGLLAGSGAASIAFFGWQRWKGDAALMPPRIVRQRTVAASCGMAFMIYAALINLTYFLPVWFQAVRGVSAIQSGINMIPYFVVNAVFSLAAGCFVSKIGYATPPAVIGSALGTAGAGLLLLLRVDTTTVEWVGYQVLTSAGFGISIQQGFTAVQTVLSPEQLPIATAAVVASQSLGGALFLSVGNSIFQSKLRQATAAQGVGGIDIKKLIDGGAASFRDLVPPESLPAMLDIYNKAIVAVLGMSIPLGALAVIISCFIEWKSVRTVRTEETAEVRNEKEESDDMEEERW